MKNIARKIVLLLVGVAFITTTHSAEKPTTLEIRKIAPLDSSIAEEWERVTTEEEVLGIGAARRKNSEWNWQIFVSAAEFVRKDPLASRLDTAITSALKKLKGVKAVVREDTEVWLVKGEVGGEELVRAGSTALDALAPELRKYLAELKKPRPAAPKHTPPTSPY
jgi:hypothetical protein